MSKEIQGFKISQTYQLYYVMYKDMRKSLASGKVYLM